MAWKLANDEAALEIEAQKAKAAEESGAANGRFQEALNAVEKLEKGSAGKLLTFIDSLRAQVSSLTEEASLLSASCASHRATAEQLGEQVRCSGAGA